MYKKMTSLKQVFFVLSVLISLSGCKTTQYLLRDRYSDPLVLPVEELCPSEINWKTEKQTGNSIQTTGNVIHSTNSKWQCIKIDLNAPGLEIAAAPEGNNSKAQKRFFLQNFSQKHKTAAAINTVPFTMEDKLYKPVNIVKINDKTIFPYTHGMAALGLKEIKTEEGICYRAVIIDSNNEDEIEQCKYAFGGFYTILNKQLIYEYSKEKRSRSAAGISDDGRYLYLFAGCGINSPTGRSGFNFQECAIILQALGCTKAMEFDGGHSTGLTLKNRNAIRPSLQRQVPAAFGIKISNKTN